MPRFSAASGIFSPSFLLRLEAAQVELLMLGGRASLVLGIYCVLRMGRKHRHGPRFLRYTDLWHTTPPISSASRYTCPAHRATNLPAHRATPFSSASATNFHPRVFLYSFCPQRKRYQSQPKSVLCQIHLPRNGKGS